MKLPFILLNNVINFPPPPTPPPPGFPVDNVVYIIGLAFLACYISYKKIKKINFE